MTKHGSHVCGTRASKFGQSSKVSTTVAAYVCFGWACHSTVRLPDPKSKKRRRACRLHTKRLAAENQLKMPARTATALKCLVCIARCQCLVSRILLNSRFIKILSNNTPDTDKLTSFLCWKAKLSMLRMHPRDTPVPLLISKEGPGATCKQLLLFRHVYRNAWIVHFLCGVSFKSHHLSYLRLFETPCKIAGPLNNVRVLLDLNMQGGHCTTSKLGRQRCNGGTHVTCTIRCGSPHSLL